MLLSFSPYICVTFVTFMFLCPFLSTAQQDQKAQHQPPRDYNYAVHQRFQHDHEHQSRFQEYEQQFHVHVVDQDRNEQAQIYEPKHDGLIMIDRYVTSSYPQFSSSRQKNDSPKIRNHDYDGHNAFKENKEEIYQNLMRKNSHYGHPHESDNGLSSSSFGDPHYVSDSHHYSTPTTNHLNKNSHNNRNYQQETSNELAQLDFFAQMQPQQSYQHEQNQNLNFPIDSHLPDETPQFSSLQNSQGTYGQGDSSPASYSQSHVYVSQDQHVHPHAQANPKYQSQGYMYDDIHQSNIYAQPNHQHQYQHQHQHQHQQMDPYYNHMVEHQHVLQEQSRRHVQDQQGHDNIVVGTVANNNNKLQYVHPSDHVISQYIYAHYTYVYITHITQYIDATTMGVINAIVCYWREVLFLCLTSSLVLNWMFAIIKRKFFKVKPSQAVQAPRAGPPRRQMSSPASTCAVSTLTTESVAAAVMSVVQQREHQVKQDNSENLNMLDDGESSSQIENLCETKEPVIKEKHIQNIARLAPNTPTDMGVNKRSTSLSDPIGQGNSILSHSPPSATFSPMSLKTSMSQEDHSFKSRYSSDFESIRRLGRGGFGVVFEAKNKIDDCHYAVKRISLPLEKDARDRVMREVRALAKLDHAGIVRYYNAWLETPPENWLRQHDDQFCHSNHHEAAHKSTAGCHTSITGDADFSTKDDDHDESSSNRFKHNPNVNDFDTTCSSDLVINSTSTRLVNGQFCHQRRATNRHIRTSANGKSCESDSPSFDVVFEGSGSIRLDTISDLSSNTGGGCDTGGDTGYGAPSRGGAPVTRRRSKHLSTIESESDTDSSDSDDGIIQFGKNLSDDKHDDIVLGETLSQLSEPFSSTSSELEGAKDKDKHQLNRATARQLSVNAKNSKNALCLLQQNDIQNLSQSLIHTEKAYLYIQMQLCRKDTLKDWLSTNSDKRDRNVVFDLFYQIVDAVEYVHSQDLIHRDLKPSNIFFSMDGVVKIGDFGLVTAKSTGIGSSLDLHESVAECDADQCIDAVHTEQVGTQLYMSPEQINGATYNHKVDIFAMGIILLELLIPFKTQMHRISVLFKARNQWFSQEFRNEYAKEHQFLKTLLCRNPQKRPSAYEIKQHELLHNVQLSPTIIERMYQTRRRTISSNSSND